MKKETSELTFSVDAALLRELGERLVGRPHIALAELIKNSYDADARNVILKFQPDSIEIVDDGHGMTFEEFRDFWMRVGTTHKQRLGQSRSLKRPLTGSKGVGRLSVQFLGARVDLATVSSTKTDSELLASVDWNEATTAGNLTSAKARYSQGAPSRLFAEDSEHGTSVLLRGLRHPWLPADIAEVAGEIRDLQPPFRPNPRLEGDAASSFHVDIESTSEAAREAFAGQMRAYLDNWYARIAGRLRPGADSKGEGEIELSIQFKGGSKESTVYRMQTQFLHACEFEIRVYYLANRQGRGIKVDSAREYVRKFGGIHIYDAGFHLPFYGPNTDWLDIERDHSHRLSVSRLLPKELQVSEGLNYLPTQGRLFGVVHVDTGHERSLAVKRESPANEALTLLVTRDRLAENSAFSSLRDTVRWALDYYAMVEAQRALAAAEKERGTFGPSAGDELGVVDSLRQKIEPRTFATLRRSIEKVVRRREAEQEVARHREGLLSALATAGIAALAYDHELGKQLSVIRSFVERTEDLARSGRPTIKSLRNLAADLAKWEERARGIRALFSGVADEENRKIVQRLNAKAVLLEVRRQASVLLRGIDVDVSGVHPELLLPKATFAEWSALFQNVVTNAINALMDASERKIVVRSEEKGQMRAIVVEDTGRGVELATAGRLFEPFERAGRISRERRALGLGGTGLGLTIVRMIASNRGAEVGFVRPAQGFSSAFQLRWSERNA